VVRRRTGRERYRRWWWWWEMCMMMREWSMGWRREVVLPTSGNVLTVAIFPRRRSVLGERANDIPDGICNLPSRIRLRRVEICLDVRSRATNFLRSATELITMRSPISAVSDVLHDAPQRGSELRVLRECGADDAKECGDVAGESGSGPGGEGIELGERRIWGIVSGRGGGWNFLDVDSTIGRERVDITRYLVDVNRRFLWGLVGEDGGGRRGAFVVPTLALISKRRRDGKCGGGVFGHAGANS
jgi:hypothetical protein